MAGNRISISRQQGRGGQRIVFINAARQSWGAEQSMYTLAREFLAMGQTVELICFRGTIEAQWQEAVGVPAITVSNGAPGRESKLRENLLLWMAYLRRHQRNDRVIVFTYYLSVATVVIRTALLGRGVRIALDLHDNLPGKRGQTLLRMSARGLNTVVACSAFTAEQVAGTRCKVLALHGPADALDPVGSTRAGPRTILIAGRIIADKRHDLVAQAISTLEDGSVMVLRGSGDGSVHDVSDAVRKECSALLGERFRDEGKVPAERVLDGADVLVVANAVEPMGRTVLEAQLSGIPVVVPDSGGSSELVQDSVTGFHFSAGNAAALASVLRAMAKEPERVAAAVKNAREQAERTVTSPEYAKRYLAALEG